MFKSTAVTGLVALSVITMGWSQTFTPVCSAGPQGANGSSGAGNCTAFTTQFCDSISQPVVADQLAAHNTITRCFLLANGDGRKCEFVIANNKTADTGTIPNDANCKSAFNAVTSNCDFGGSCPITIDTMSVELNFHVGGC
ncbi:hypothetical protein B0H19DRAFT_1256028 [Mycena capillaripes]|nr:hypothetical protein B0H19DRAFT_1256028 [Mycena capillaripes]